MKTIKPKLNFNNEQNPLEPIVWFSKVDERYQLEVIRSNRLVYNNKEIENSYSGYVADLYLFDHNKDDKLILQKEVWLNYGARFGVDIENVREWETEIIDFIDNKYHAE